MVLGARWSHPIGPIEDIGLNIHARRSPQRSLDRHSQLVYRLLPIRELVSRALFKLNRKQCEKGGPGDTWNIKPVNSFVTWITLVSFQWKFRLNKGEWMDAFLGSIVFFHKQDPLIPTLNRKRSNERNNWGPTNASGTAPSLSTSRKL